VQLTNVMASRYIHQVAIVCSSPTVIWKIRLLIAHEKKEMRTPFWQSSWRLRFGERTFTIISENGSAGSEPDQARGTCMALKIEDYAVIGDCKTAAPIGRNGLDRLAVLAEI